jgi:hypothetical protein
MNMDQEMDEQQLAPPEIPSAIVVPINADRPTRWWWLTACCVLVSVSLFFYSQQTIGEPIVIEFLDGYGIKPEDRLKHHGIDVGQVEKVELSSELDRVLVHVRLQRNASTLARDGTQFWIVRPTFSIDSVGGLETILGAKYLAVAPGPAKGPKASRFLGLETPPVASAKDGSLEILLDSGTRGGLSNGAPILYRGYKIGSVLQVGLATDARSVRARCAIEPEYRDLVRTNTKFWNRSGWRLNIGLTGIKLDADSIAQVVSGGIEMATPDSPEPAVNMGHRFVLHEEAKPEWTQWQPSIGHGELWNRLENRLPQPQRMALRWQERSYGFRVNRQLTGWCLPLDDGSVLCLKEQLVAPEAALGDTVSIEVAGLSWAPSSIQWLADSGSTPQDPRIIRFRPANRLPDDVAVWASKNVAAAPSTPCSIVLACDDPNSSVSLDAGRFVADGVIWSIDSSVVLSNDLLGVPVIRAESNEVIGLLVPNSKASIVVLLK